MFLGFLPKRPDSVELLHTSIAPSMVSSSLTARAGGAGGAPHFLKTKIIIKLRNTHFQIKGIFDGIRIFVWQTSPTHPNLWLVRFDPISSVVRPPPPPQGDNSRKIGWGCAARFVKPTPYFRPKSVIFPTFFQTWSKIWYPILELTLKSIS